jgi:hypothetical protein
LAVDFAAPLIAIKGRPSQLWLFAETCPDGGWITTENGYLTHSAGRMPGLGIPMQ